MPDSPKPDTDPVRTYLLDLQEQICVALEKLDGKGRFEADPVEFEGGGESRPRVLTEGAVFEKGAVNFSHSVGDRLPPAAVASRPELAGRGFRAVSLSLILHPWNPYVPTSHANFRFFIAGEGESDPVWWFGGGFDLTPFYGFVEDAVHWHRTAREACEGFGVYDEFKEFCDRYFYLPHREEARGVGGLFFDDLNRWDFGRTFEFVRSVGDAYLKGYVPLVERRRHTEYGEREREFQLYRRGRYVEFNLIYDRGTLYGLQSGRRVETVLSSLPPRVRWDYKRVSPPGSPEARLAEEFLKPRDWLGENEGAGS